LSLNDLSGKINPKGGKMKQVKVFTQFSYIEIQAEINNWLLDAEYSEILDIKFCVDCEDEEGDCTRFTSMIIYNS
jgi:hypothetical protein